MVVMTDRQKESDCIFCTIAASETPADVVWEDEETIFFNDISPKARVHVLAIPKKHIKSLAKMSEEDVLLMGKLMHNAVLVAERLGVNESGYRLITNVGPDAGQDVEHVHWHLMGGEKLGPLRC